jgi:metacaspase-1
MALKKTLNQEETHMATTKKITLNDLYAKLADPKITKTELSKYFIDDADEQRPFSARMTVNPDTVILPADKADARARSALALNLLNSAYRFQRDVDFAIRYNDPDYKLPVIVSEGDSWFQYPLKLEDVIDQLAKTYAIKSLDAAGDTLADMIAQDEFVEAIEDVGASIFLISAGGNDLVANGGLADHLRDFDPLLPPSQYLLESFDDLLSAALATYGSIFQKVEQRFPALHTICHGYDYTVPNSGKWLGNPMAARGIKDKVLQKAIAHEMVDRFNSQLARTAANFPGVTYIDCRGVVTEGRWYDELHPTNAGYAAVAELFDAVIKKYPRQDPIARATGPRAKPPGSSRAKPKSKPAAPAVHKPKRDGISLHIGLNAVNPVGHYQGWDGQLEGCENDANDMKDIAKQMHYDWSLLLTKDATRANVKKAIKAAAAKLKSGDCFLITYSGHGGQVPDYNHDEDGSKPDSTWCLYDAEHVDDENYALWTEFQEGVRVVIVSDSCHSGSIAKAQFEGTLTADLRNTQTGARARAMPPRMASRVAQANREFYRDIAASLPLIKYSMLTGKTKNPLRCSVRSLAACKDEQLSYEQAGQGNFTLQLMSVWNGGQFKGTYASFLDAIKENLKLSPQTPHHMQFGQPNPAFDAQGPFAI